ncbi:MAG: glycine cleavage system protein H [Candidatus Methanomethylicota archaeon]|uniref:Probable glycine cleavage system H protein n=1 Tax=Thermoproteota archaeon TaxID=2056631 RepID=A0A497ESC0_9CREN|nr:MAG: glycine cleavage system protein H [Candidatus Verstraetearchaeota archaeon]
MAVIEGFNIPEELFYWLPGPRKGHTWAQILPDGRVKVGLDDVGQAMAGKLIFFRPKPKGTAVEQGKPFGTIETAKWVGPLESPVSGTIAEINDAARKKPSLINSDPYGEGWLVIIQPNKLEEEKQKLLTGSAAVEAEKQEIEREKLKK